MLGGTGVLGHSVVWMNVPVLSAPGLIPAVKDGRNSPGLTVPPSQ